MGSEVPPGDAGSEPEAGSEPDAGRKPERDAGHEPGVTRRRSREERRQLQRKRAPVSLPEAPESHQGLLSRLSHFIERLEGRVEGSYRKSDRVGLYVLRVFIQVVRQWAHDRCFEKASSLAFQTVLSMVPLLALALVILRWSGSINAESSFVEFIARELIPVSPEVIAEKLSAWSGNVSIQSLGIVGLTVTLLFAFVLVNSMENMVNVIWRSERKRSLTQKFVVFYASITIGPFLMGTSLYQAAKYGLTEGFSGLLFSLATSYGALLMANYFLPANEVRPGPAALGALVSTALFELARFAFQVYVTEFAFASYSGIYGALGLVPLLLLWVYYSWLMFLFGIEVAHVTQNIQYLQRRDRRRPMSLENELLQRVNGVVAARIMLSICAAYMHGEKVMPRRALEEMFDLSTDAFGRIADRLKKSDLIIEVTGEHRGYLPARPPSEIAVAEVMAAFRGEDIKLLSDHPRSTLDRILAEIEKDTRSRTKELFFDELA